MSQRGESLARVGRGYRRLAVAAAAVIAVLLISGCGGSSGGSGSGSGSGNSDSEFTNFKTYVGENQPSEYWTGVGQGIDGVATSAGGQKSQVLSDPEAGDQNARQFSSIFARGCKNCVALIDPLSPQFATRFVTAAARSKTYTVLMWSKPESLWPWTSNRYFVAYVTYDAFDAGYQVATALFKSMGGKGGVIGLQGLPSDVTGQGRKAGFEAALKKFPNIKLLDSQPANWSQAPAQQITQTLLTKYGSQIKGVYAANDSMGLGALAALQAAGKAGKVPVTGTDGGSEVLGNIKKGTMVATMQEYPGYQGATMAALAIAAAKGDIDPDKLTHEQRAFYLKQALVTRDNVEKIEAEIPPASAYTYEAMRKNLWQRSAGPIKP